MNYYELLWWLTLTPFLYFVYKIIKNKHFFGYGFRNNKKY